MTIILQHAPRGMGYFALTGGVILEHGYERQIQKGEVVTPKDLLVWIDFGNKLEIRAR